MMNAKTSKSGAGNEAPLILVDGSSYLYRAFHALPPLTTSKGKPTGAIYGVANMLRRIPDEYGSDNIAVVFDAKGKTFRDELFEEYKANRPPMPDDLREQVEPLHELVKALGFPVLQVSGVEADDVIGTLADQAIDAGQRVVISTGDKDMAQLVREGMTLVNTMTGKVMDRDGVKEKFDVWPEQIIDYLALVGDTSDNIPGVPKVGPKTAAKWLNEYETLDAIIENADDIKGKVGESLRDNIDQLKLSRELATIRTDVALDVKPGELQMNERDTENLRRIFIECEFRSWLEQLDANEGGSSDEDAAPAGDLDVEYETIFTEKALDTWLEKLEKADLFAFDTETTSIHYMEAELVGLSFAVEPGKAAYVPLAHSYAGAPEQLDRDAVLKKLKPLLENPERKKVGQHMKYDMHVLEHYGIQLKGLAHDTMLESYVLNSTANRHDMDTLALAHLGVKTIKYEDVAGKGKKQLRFDEVGIEEAAPYAAEDADITLRLHQALWPRLEKEKSLRELYTDMEVPLASVLQRIEHNGVLIDRQLLADQSHEITEKLAELERKAFDEAGQEFNLGSPKQLQAILFEQQGLPVIRKTPKGQPSTAEDVLQELAGDYALPAIIMEHRALAKLKSTYTDKLPNMIAERTGRVHTSYQQAVAATGRLSSSDPNLQNIPIRTPEGRRIRKAFIAPEGYRIMAADYSQIELRIMAHLSGDESLVKAFQDDKDIHRATAAEIHGKALDEVSDEERRSAKAINFGLIYGMSAFGLAKQLGIGRNEAQQYVDLYFERYPGVKRYMEETRERAKQQGYVETIAGRRLYLPEINARNAQVRQYAERTAINAPMQGTAADIIKRAMLKLDAWLADNDIDAKMIMQVHDELVFEVAEGDLDHLRDATVEQMVASATLDVPLKVDVGVGMNWDEAH
ncbi:MAG: DNA polymerase I [Gammaproteobacteria bacterium]|nr:DNA polymerase I [Gammaproteobacteria bacterium]